METISTKKVPPKNTGTDRELSIHDCHYPLDCTFSAREGVIIDVDVRMPRLLTAPPHAS